MAKRKTGNLRAFDCYSMSFTPKAILWHGKSCEVPVDVAKCPECSGELYVYCHGWHTDMGQPIAADLQIDCENEKCFDDDDGFEHRWFQSDWQPIRDAVVKWSMADTSFK